MELDVRIDNDSILIPIDNPFQLDIDGIMEKIDNFVSSKGTNLNGLDVRGLIPKMVRGVAGCEGGCPANAKDLVERGFKNFQLCYIEGGILSAMATTGNGKTLTIKMFPEF